MLISDNNYGMHRSSFHFLRVSVLQQSLFHGSEINEFTELVSCTITSLHEQSVWTETHYKLWRKNLYVLILQIFLANMELK